MKKAAIELSANFLVVIIISIIILGAGLVMFFRLQGNVDTQLKQIDDQNKQILRDMMLKDTTSVAVYPNDLEIDNGKTGRTDIAITNSFSDAQNFQIFIITVKYFATPNVAGADLNWGNNFDGQLVMIDSSGNLGTINPKDQIYKGMHIKMPKDAASGEYIITLRVKNNCPGACTEYGVINIHVVNP